MVTACVPAQSTPPSSAYAECANPWASYTYQRRSHAQRSQWNNLHAIVATVCEAPHPHDDGLHRSRTLPPFAHLTIKPQHIGGSLNNQHGTQLHLERTPRPDPQLHDQIHFQTRIIPVVHHLRIHGTGIYQHIMRHH